MLFRKVKGFLDLLKQKRITTVAGAWVFFFLTALLPLVFLLITAFGVFGVKLSTMLAGRVPEEFRPVIELLISTAENTQNGITLFFFLTVLFSGSALLNQMSKDGEFIYGLKHEKRGGVLRRVWAILGISVLFVVFLGTALLFAFKNMLFASFDVSGKYKILVSAVAFLIIILISYLVIILLNRFVSPVKLRFSGELLGGFISLFIIVLGTIGFMVYLRFFNSYNAFYGSLATVIIFLLWAYILMLGLSVGVTVNMLIYEKDAGLTKKSKKLPLSTTA